MPALALPVAIDAVIIAILAAILIWASTPLWRPILQAMARLPFIGAYVAGLIESTVAVAIQASASWASAAIQPLAQLVYNVAWGFYFYRDASVHVAESTYNAINGIVTIKLPQLEGRAAELTRLLVTQTQMLARLFFTQSLMYTDALVGLLRADTQLLVTQTQMLARLFFTQSLMYTELLVTQLTQYTQLLVTQTQMLARDLFRQAEELDRLLEDMLAGYARALFTQALTYVDRQLLDLRNFLDWARRQDLEYVRGLIGAAAVALALTIAGVVARVKTLEDSPCQKYCNPLGDLGQLLQGVEDAGLVALLLALSAQMAHDPKGTAHAIDQLIGPEVREITSGLGQDAGFRRVA